ncbi:glycoside hydrolase family 19 protein [Paraburkholderia sp. Tr-20389]|uniref:glycoside hydrolase family 19 protein n=1 Tax=Paraburkholderia sp. Tr-20389 TaxID=2703903 RepID=UPI0019825A7D|nr:glycoside hydrolase family 19 protein [Paraburkholderia sp. Tr-20389]MBN3757244.1 glycoside hydrolase family 19 protein [Paraburkholderia sp. Tr-20389]
MNLTAQIVAAGCGATLLRSAQWVSPLQATCDKYFINTPLRVAAFLAQCGVESARLTALSENLNYSATGLLTTFPKYFNAVEAAQYERQPQRIANRVYANRYGNGNEASGDGFRFRGRGLLQVTFKDNYAACGKAIALPLTDHPELLEQPCNAALAAGWYWDSRDLNKLADAGKFEGITRAINGGLNGYSERLALYSAAKRALGIQPQNG